MDIAIDVSQMVYQGTGVGRYVYGLTKALLIAPTSHTFTLYAGTLRRRKELLKLSQTKPFNQANWKIWPLPPQLSGWLFNSTPLPIESLIGRHDLFHASDWTEPATSMPRVTTVHDLAFHYYPETVDPLVLATQRKRLKRIVSHATHIIADSLSTKQDLLQIYRVPEKRIDVVYPGIETSFKPQSKQEIARVKRLYNLPDRFLLSVGTQEPRKNIARLVAAAEATGLPLILVGRHGWGDKTQTLGFVPASDLPALYSAAAVFAYPSLYEGFGFPVAEAMAAGTPVVTSNVSSLPEVAGKAAILVDPLDVESISQGIKRALAGSARLKAAGLQQVKQFTWEKCAAKTLGIYEKIIKLDKLGT